MSGQIGAIEEARSPSLMGTSEKRKKRAEWDDLKKDHFVGLLVLCRNKNGQSKEMWPKDAWVTITVEMSTKFEGSNFSTQQLKQMERDLKKTYRSMKDFMRKYDLRFDEYKCIIEASPHVWRKVFQDDPKAKRWHGKMFPYYPKLDILYRGGNASSQKHQFLCNNGKHSLQANSTYVDNRTNGGMNQTLNPTNNPAQPINSEEHYKFRTTTQCNSLAELNPESFQYSQIPLDCDEPSQREDYNKPINQVGAWGTPSPIDLITPISYPQIMPPSTTFGCNEPSQIQDYTLDQFNHEQAQHCTLVSADITSTNHAIEFVRRLNLNGASSSSCPTLAQCITEYNNLPEFDGNFVYHVVEILKDRKNRQVFLGYRDDNRVIWLKQQIATRIRQQ